MGIKEFIRKTEHRVNAAFIRRDIADIEWAKKMAEGKGCGCNQCVSQGEKLGNYSIKDLSPNDEGKYGFIRDTTGQKPKLTYFTCKEDRILTNRKIALLGSGINDGDLDDESDVNTPWTE